MKSVFRLLPAVLIALLLTAAVATAASKPTASGSADISFYCDDLAATVAELQGRGVEFTQQIEDHGYGWVTFFKAPGEFKVQLYQAKYAK